MDLPTIIATGSGVAGGSISVGWIAKLLITRYLKENDKRHEKGAEAIEKLAKVQAQAWKELTRRLQEVETGIRVIEARIGETLTLASDVKNNVRDIAVHDQRIDRNSTDISRGFQSIRGRLTKVEHDVDEVAKSVIKSGS